MTIGFDISMLVYIGSGVASYTWQLAKALVANNKDNYYNFFYSSFRRPAGFYDLSLLNSARSKVYDYCFPPKLLKYMWNKKHFLPVNKLIGKCDWYFSSDFLRPPLAKGTKGITTIHDLTWKIYPQHHTSSIVDAHERKMQKTIKYCDIIITDSENTKKDIYKYYPAIKNPVYVVYPGIDGNFKNITDVNTIKKVLQKYQVRYPANYLLYVGAIEPRKNLKLCIEVFAALVKKNGYADYNFLIVGRAGWKNEEVYNLVKKLNLQKKIYFVGYVADKDLPYFYNGAKLLLYLSVYEGFGLPPLEALCCHTKILSANNSSLKEVIKDRFFLADISNSEAVVKKAVSVISKDIAKPIFEKYRRIYSWKKYTEKLTNILRAS